MGTLSSTLLNICGEGLAFEHFGLDLAKLVHGLEEASGRLRLVATGQGRVTRGVEQGAVGGSRAVERDRLEVERLVMRFQLGDLGVDPLDQPGSSVGLEVIVLLNVLLVLFEKNRRLAPDRLRQELELGAAGILDAAGR